MSVLAETRKFSIHPDIIFSLIKAQAGSLGKALAECVMNSIDAFATRVDIDFNAHALTVRDNGQGFRNRDEVLAWFEVLGFPHDEGNHRRFGKFGMGRAQLWSFASTVWRTNDFELDVDIKQRGLDYELRELAAPVKGLVIDARLYEPLGLDAQTRLADEFKALVRFAPAEVYLNGKRVSSDPAQESWEVETREAWMTLQTKRTESLVIYNQGVLVTQAPFYRYKVSGVICTKPGQALTLNMARNAILESECKVWGRIRRSFPEQPVAAARAERPSEPTLRTHVAELMAKSEPTEADLEALIAMEALTEVTGRWTSLAARVRYNAPGIVTVAPKGDALGKLAQTRKLAWVLDAKTLERFGATSASEMGALLRTFVEKASPKSKNPSAYSAYRFKDNFARLRWVDSVVEALPELAHDCEVLSPKELSELEKGVWRALSHQRSALRMFLMRIAPPDSPWAKMPQARGRSEVDIFIGKSPTHRAWTDGASRIVVERRTAAELAREGVSGFSVLIQLVLAEMLYERPTIGREAHGAQEQALLARAVLEPQLFDLALTACYRFASTAKENYKVSRKLLWRLDALVDATEPPAAAAAVSAPAL